MPICISILNLGSLSLQHSTSLSSPYSHRSLKTPLSPLPGKPRWTKQFKFVKKSIDHSTRLDTFVTRARAGTAETPLAAIDSTAGKGECLAQTEKQWETIIKQAKADDKVPDDMKAAKFFHFGHVLRDPKPTKPSEAYVFVRRLSESKAKEEIEGLTLPLEAYVADRQQKIRRRQLVKVVRNIAEEGRVAIRNVRRDVMHDLRELKEAGEAARTTSGGPSPICRRSPMPGSTNLTSC